MRKKNKEYFILFNNYIECMACRTYSGEHISKTVLATELRLVLFEREFKVLLGEEALAYLTPVVKALYISI